MLGAFAAFLACMGAIFWFLWKEYGDGDDVLSSSKNLSGGRRRRNKRKAKKGGRKPEAESCEPPLGDPTLLARGHGHGRGRGEESVRKLEDRSGSGDVDKTRGSQGVLLDDDQWPALRRDADAERRLQVEGEGWTGGVRVRARVGKERDDLRKDGRKGGINDIDQSCIERKEEEREEDLAVLHAAILDDNQCRREALNSLRGGNADADANADADISGESESVGERGKVAHFGVGDMVDARYLGGKEWFPAKITKTLNGGLVNLMYDDGEKETKVHLSLVRKRRRRVTQDYDDDYDDDHDDTDGSDTEEADDVPGVFEGPGRLNPGQQRRLEGASRDGWEVKLKVSRPRKTQQERVELRTEASTKLKNRLKRQKKREREIAAREALRKKL